LRINPGTGNRQQVTGTLFQDALEILNDKAITSVKTGTVNLLQTIVLTIGSLQQNTSSSIRAVDTVQMLLLLLLPA
jgi:hypothetical protein